METWITKLINSAIGGVKDLAAAAMERILWVYGIVVAVGTAIRQGWGTVTSAARFWRTKIISFGIEIYSTLWYIVWVRIPTVISSTVDNIVAFVTYVVNDVEARLTQGIALLTNWIVDRVREFLDFIDRLREYLLRRFGEIWDWIERAGALVFTLLTSPDRMAAWLFGALVSYLLRFIDENAESIADLIQRRTVYYAGRIAIRIEQVLVRLL